MSQQLRGRRAGGGSDDDRGRGRAGREYGGFGSSVHRSDRGGYQHRGGGRGNGGFSGNYQGSSDRGGYERRGRAPGSDRGGYLNRGGNYQGSDHGVHRGRRYGGHSDRGAYNNNRDRGRGHGGFSGNSDEGVHSNRPRDGQPDNGSNLDLHQANQPSIPNPTWEEGSSSSSSSSQEKKIKSSDLSHQFGELSVHLSSSPSPKFTLRPTIADLLHSKSFPHDTPAIRSLHLALQCCDEPTIKSKAQSNCDETIG